MTTLLAIGVLGIWIPTADAITCTGVILRPTDSIQAAIDLHPEDTTFCLTTGIYRPAEAISPKAGQVFIGAAGTIIDGRGVVSRGFRGSAPEVTIRRITIRNFEIGIDSARNWTIVNSEMASNSRTGVRLKGFGTLRGSHVHHNGLGGVFGAGPNVLVVNNEIAYNHRLEGICTGKFVFTTDLIVRDNHYHHNRCPALWVDVNNFNAILERNILNDNGGQVIDCEISYRCIIRHNTVRNNKGGIMASNSPDVRIYGNTLSNNGEFEIRIHHQGPRNDYPSEYGPHLPKNNYVHHNEITLTKGYVGVTEEPSPRPYIFSPEANNRFDHNTYTGGTRAGKYFHWESKRRTWQRWRRFGHDRLGTFTRAS